MTKTLVATPDPEYTETQGYPVGFEMTTTHSSASSTLASNVSMPEARALRAQQAATEQAADPNFVYVADIRSDEPIWHSVTLNTMGGKWLYTHCGVSVSFGGHGVVLPKRHAVKFAEGCPKCAFQ